MANALTSVKRSDAISQDSPLLLMMHGYGSHEGDLPGLAPHLPAGFDWVSLRAPGVIADGSYQWFPLADLGRLAVPEVMAATADVLAWVEQNVAPGRPVVPIGFSQGGLMVTQLLRSEPERFAAGVVLSGFVLSSPLPGDEELAAIRPPVFFGYGDADPIVAAQLTQAALTWLGDHTALHAHLYPWMAHQINGAELRDLWDFLTGLDLG